MSYTKVPSLRRIAIWEVHGRKCIYCSEPVAFADLEIDHILPEQLLKKPRELESILASYSLPADFDLNDLRNLIPTHRRCNSRKTGMVLSRNASIYFLEITAAKVERASIQEQVLIKRSRGERVIASLQFALETGELSRLEVMDILKKIESGADAFEIIQEIEFSNQVVKGLLRQNDVESLLDEPILPRKYGLEYLEMAREVAGQVSSRMVRTCREWAEAIREGYWARTTYDIKEETFFKRVYALVRAMSNAQIANQSFISHPMLGIADLNLLPVTMLPYLNGREELIAMDRAGLTILDLVKDKRVIVENHSTHYLSLIFEGMGKAYWEILRADLNSDGIEDILLSTYSYATEGTLGFGDVEIITIKSVGSKFENVSSAYLLP